MRSKIEDLIDKLAEQYPDSECEISVEDFAYWLQKNAAPAVERQSDEKHEAHCVLLDPEEPDTECTCPHRFMFLADDPRRCADCDAVEVIAPPELAELQAQLATASRMFDEVENSLADSCLREEELQATIERLKAENERLKEVTNFKDAVACVFDMLKYTAANTGSREWDEQLEDLADDVIEYAPEYKKQWKDIAKLSAEIERLKGGQGEPVVWQYMTHPTWDKGDWPTDWTDCTKEAHDDYVRTPLVADWEYRTRKLFTSQPAPVSVVLPTREAMRDLIAEVVGGDTYDCTRVWSAWGVGTMSEDDFVSFAEQDERLYELADACLDKVKELNQ